LSAACSFLTSGTAETCAQTPTYPRFYPQPRITSRKKVWNTAKSGALSPDFSGISLDVQDIAVTSYP
jgi:hypothetical protein